MKTVLFALALLCLPFAAFAANDKHSVESGGVRRDFYVHVPENLKGKEDLPVVLVLHGGGGSAENARRQTGMDEVADKSGFIAVYPEGTSAPLIDKMRTWNTGPCCGYAARKKINGVAFISGVIDELIKLYKIDTNRVYATGHSNGAMMSYRLACELSQRIAAIAPNAGQRLMDECKPERPVPVLHIHGTKDPCAPFEGGEQCGGCYSKMLGGWLKPKNDTWPCRPVREVVREQAVLNGCEATTDIFLTKGAVTCERFKCPANATVALCSIEGAGHMWAGTHDNGPAVCRNDAEKKVCSIYRETVGPQNTDVDAGELAWDFLRHYSLKGAIE